MKAATVSGTFLQDGFLQKVRCGDPGTHGRIVRNEAIRIRRLDMDKARKLAAEHRPENRDTRGAHRCHRHAVVAEIATDDLGLLRLTLGDPEKARRLECGFDGFAAASGEKEMIDRGISERRQFFGQLDCRDVRCTDVSGNKSQLLHLTSACSRKILASMPEADVPQS